MIVTLIPLFLAANIAVHESDWKYGPEVIYNVQFDATAQSQDSLLENVTTNSTFKLKCRSQHQLILNCHFQESRHVLTMLKPGKNKMIKDNDEFLEDGPGNDIFQLKFCPEGIHEIVVSSSIHPAKLDMIRALVGQLNIGTDLSERNTSSTFDMMEKSAAGVCMTICDLSVKAIDKDDAKKVQNNSYKLVNIGGSIYPGLELQELRKTRNLDKCLYRADYFYGSREAQRIPPSVIETKLKSSKSKMTIKENKFTSYIENMVTVSDKQKLSTIMIITERITLSLEDIVPADGPIPKINNPSRASIYPTTWLRDDSSEELQDNESS